MQPKTQKGTPLRNLIRQQSNAMRPLHTAHGILPKSEAPTATKIREIVSAHAARCQ